MYLFRVHSLYVMKTARDITARGYQTISQTLQQSFGLGKFNVHNNSNAITCLSNIKRNNYPIDSSSNFNKKHPQHLRDSIEHRVSLSSSIGASSISKRNLSSTNTKTSNNMACVNVSYLNQQDAQNVDVDLMGPYAFSIDQLMELAGLSVASAVEDAFPMSVKKILVICGPGNNGGDGLVAARHLIHFGNTVDILYPKRTDKQLYKNLVIQCESLNANMLNEIPGDLSRYDVIIDAIFGFSFQGAVRAPFDSIIDELKKTAVPIVSVDIPSGWDVEKGDSEQKFFNPAVLVSLTAPKLCARNYQGIHYIGGRFVPPALIEKYKLILPRYHGSAAFARL